MQSVAFIVLVIIRGSFLVGAVLFDYYHHKRRSW
jgi:hypothetical protein